MLHFIELFFVKKFVNKNGFIWYTKGRKVQGVSGLNGFFEFDISDTYNAATVL